MGKSAIIAGASGLVGKQLMYKLLENQNYSKIYVLVRKEMSLDHPKLEQIIVNYDALYEAGINKQIDDAYCCLGTTMKKAGSKEAFYKVDYTYVVNFARYSQSKGVKNFALVSAIDSDKNSKIYYSKVKGETEEKLKVFRFDHLVIARPSFLLGDREEFRLGEKLALAASVVVTPLLFGKWKRYKPVHCTKVAEALINQMLSDKKGTSIIESDKIV
ncbi:MAG: NAD(P)H-binding protein [Bacteroidota bacterium]|nr:NAD(P)H-binding protein [Bacteroidota bacterium]